jgi:hypothetical protein
MVKSVDDLCRFIWSLEQKYDLLEYEVDGVKIWQYLRMEIYYDLAKKTKVLEERKLTREIKLVNIKKAIGILINAVRFSPFLCNIKGAKIVFPHNRSVISDGHWLDIYTHFYFRKHTQSEVLFIEKPFHGEHVRKRTAHTFYSDHILISSVLRGKFYRIKERNKIEKITQIRNELKEKLGFDLELEKLFSQNIGRFKSSYKYYYRLFKRLKPQEIYLVVSYAFMSDMIKAAKDLKIPTTEFQHGVISRYHLGYSFPVGMNNNNLPDRIFVWGGFWEKTLEAINFNAQIEKIGFDFFRKKIKKYETFNKENQSILVLSQTALGDKIMSAIITNKHLFEGFTIYYKLHPEEYLMYKSYPSYKQLTEVGSIHFLENSDLYDLMAKCDRQIGVFSTALYEGLAFNCKTYLLDLPGIEYMSDLIEIGHAQMLSEGNWKSSDTLDLDFKEFF